MEPEGKDPARAEGLSPGAPDDETSPTQGVRDLIVPPGRLGLTLQLVHDNLGTVAIVRRIDPACPFAEDISLGEGIVSVDGTPLRGMADLHANVHKQRVVGIVPADGRTFQASPSIAAVRGEDATSSNKLLSAIGLDIAAAAALPPEKIIAVVEELIKSHEDGDSIRAAISPSPPSSGRTPLSARDKSNRTPARREGGATSIPPSIPDSAMPDRDRTPKRKARRPPPKTGVSPHYTKRAKGGIDDEEPPSRAPLASEGGDPTLLAPLHFDADGNALVWYVDTGRVEFISLEQAKSIETRGVYLWLPKVPPEQREALYKALKNGDIAGVRAISDLFNHWRFGYNEMTGFVRRVKAGESYVAINDFLIVHVSTEWPREMELFWRYVWWRRMLRQKGSRTDHYALQDPDIIEMQEKVQRFNETGKLSVAEELGKDAEDGDPEDGNPEDGDDERINFNKAYADSEKFEEFWKHCFRGSTRPIHDRCSEDGCYLSARYGDKCFQCAPTTTCCYVDTDVGFECKNRVTITSGELCFEHIQCSREGCKNPVCRDGLCIKHRYKSERKKCSAPGCTNRAQNNGVCIRHGAKCAKRTKCSAPGCKYIAQKGGFCVNHGANKRKQCSAPGCTNIVQNNGVCIRHGARKRKCSEPECTNRAQNNGVCTRHGAKCAKRKCAEPECNNISVRGGVCISHGANGKQCSAKGCINRGLVCIEHGVIC